MVFFALMRIRLELIKTSCLLGDEQSSSRSNSSAMYVAITGIPGSFEGFVCALSFHRASNESPNVFWEDITQVFDRCPSELKDILE